MVRPLRRPISCDYCRDAKQETCMTLVKGAFNNYMDRIMSFFSPPPPPPCVDSFYTLSVDKNRHFLTPSPPHLVHVVIECPLV